MISELQLTVFLNGYSPLLLKAAYYASMSLYLLIPAAIILAARQRGLKSGAYSFLIMALIYAMNSGLKLVFNVHRPDGSGINLIEKETDGSFPSGHGALAFGAAAISGRRALYLWAGLVSVSRLILGLHYLSDVVAGAILGWLIGSIAAKYERNILNAFFSRRNIFETRRQLFHALFGSLVSLSVYFLPEYFSTSALFLGALIALAVSYAAKKRISLYFVGNIMDIFERKKDAKAFPLKGTIFFILGALISVLLFTTNIAAASIAILALGDCASTLVGKPFGKTKLAHNKNKSLEGSAAGFSAAFLGAVFLIQPKIALIGALSGMIIESFDLRAFGFGINDNLSVPVVSGAVMTAALLFGI